MKKYFTPIVFLSLSSLFSRLLGVVRDRLLAVNFGALESFGIYDLDTYYAAFRLPDLIYSVLVMGTVSAAFVPIFIKYINADDKKNAWEFTSTVLNLVLVFLLTVSVLLFVFAPWVVKVIAPGFERERLDLTVNLTRIMLISPIFFGLSSIAQGIQNTFKSFFYYSLAPIIYNLSIIAGIVFLSEKYGVYGVTIGVVAGAFLHFSVQLPAILKLGFRYKFSFDFKRPDVKRLVTLIIPRIFGVSALQLALLVDTMIASTLMVGSVTVLNYAINLNSLPMGIVGVSVAIAAFSTLSGLANESQKDSFSKVLRDNIEKILYLIIPASTGLYLLRYEIVGLILRGGKFTNADMILTADTLGIFAIGLFAQSLIPLLGRAFYAFENTKTPVKISIAAVFLNAVLSYLFAKIFGIGVRGIALANVIAGFLNFFLLILMMDKILINFRNYLRLRKIGYWVFSSVIMAIAVLVSKTVLLNILGKADNSLNYLLYTGVLSLVGAGVYFLLTRKDLKKMRLLETE